MSYGADLRAGLLDFNIAPAPVVVAWEPEPDAASSWYADLVGDIRARRAVRDARLEVAREVERRNRWKVGGDPIEPVEPPAFVEVALNPGVDRHGFVKLRAAGCGELYVVRATCSDALCVECMKRKTSAAARRWLPALESMRHPKLMTLTIQNFERAADARDVLQKSFRRFCDLSLGSRNLAALLDEARAFVALDCDVERRARSLVELDRLEKRVRRKWRESDEPVRVRDLLGRGFRSVEVTHGDGGFHFHIHAALDCWYLPVAFVRAAWLRGTRGAGEIVDVRRIGRGADDIREVTKYICKSWELPPGLADELRNAIYRMQRVKAIGGAKPVDVHVCPCCGREDCQSERVGHAMRQLELIGLPDGRRAALVDDAGRAAWLVEDGAIWREASGPLLDTCAIELQNLRRMRGASGAGGGGPGPPGAVG